LILKVYDKLFIEWDDEKKYLIKSLIQNTDLIDNTD
jgi:hypothetical protein